ncbi:hypothetical protein ABZP36_019560 [Zizania latifolia]
MVSISMYRGNLHRAGADAERQWPSPRPTITAGRFRRLLRSRSLAVGRLDGATRAADSANSASSSRLADGDAGEAEEVDQEMNDEEHQEEEEGEGEEGDGQQQQEEEEEDGPDEQQPEEAGEEQDEGAVEDVDMDDAGEVVVGGDDAVDPNGSGDTQEGQGESEGFDPNPEGDLDVIEERKRELNDKLNTLNKKKHDLVQMLKQILNAEEEIRMHSIQASLRTAVPQPSENAADGSSVSRQVPRLTVDVNFSEVAVESDAGSNQGTPGRPLHHVHRSHSKKPLDFLYRESIPVCSYWTSRASYWPSLNIVARNQLCSLVSFPCRIWWFFFRVQGLPPTQFNVILRLSDISIRFNRRLCTDNHPESAVVVLYFYYYFK